MPVGMGVLDAERGERLLAGRDCDGVGLLMLMLKSNEGGKGEGWKRGLAKDASHRTQRREECIEEEGLERRRGPPWKRKESRGGRLVSHAQVG